MDMELLTYVEYIQEHEGNPILSFHNDFPDGTLGNLIPLLHNKADSVTVGSVYS